MRRFAAVGGITILLLSSVYLPEMHGYALNYTVADMRRPAAESGGSACPMRNRVSLQVTGGISRRWSTALSPSVVTQAAVESARIAEVEASIFNSYNVWAHVAGSALKMSSLGVLGRTSNSSACSFGDGLNTICFNQHDGAFQSGVLAFTRVVTSDALGERLGVHPPSEFIGEILDADIYFRPQNGIGSMRFATPGALPTNPSAMDLESILTHELGHLFGLGHTGIWRGMMFPFAPIAGQFTGERPTAQQRDAPLSDDDRTGIRALYPDASDFTHFGEITGKVIPVNPLSLAEEPAGVTGMFGANVVVVDAENGTVISSVLAGWSCSGSGPPVFDGSYRVERLAVGADRRYMIYAEPLDGPVSADAVIISLSTPALCRNPATDSGWPSQFACTPPLVNTEFATRFRPGNQ